MTQMNKYFLYSSLIFNGGLLIYLFGAIPFFLFLSFVANVALAWFIKNTLSKEASLEEDVIGVVEKIDMFSEHIEKLHQLEMYYGDEQLQSLMEHSSQLVNDFIDFQEKYFDVDIQAEADEEDPSET